MIYLHHYRYRRRIAVSPESVLPKLVEVFTAFETDPSGPGAVWKLAEGINRSTRGLGPNLRHLVAAEGGYIGFLTCRQKHGLIGHTGSAWVMREGSGRPRRGDLEDALTYLAQAIECAAAGAALAPAEAFLEALYRSGEPTAEPNELELYGALLSLEQSGPETVYLNYLYLSPSTRGQGTGGKVLGLLADLADQHCVSLELRARSFRITDPYSRELDKSPGENLVSTEALVKLYSKFGFRGEARYMERAPSCVVQKAASRLVAASTTDYEQFRLDLQKSGIIRDRNADTKLREFYDRTVSRLVDLDGKDCWRAIRLARGTDVVGLATIGPYWTWKKDASFSWDASNPKDPAYIFRARIDLHVCNWRNTVFNAYVNPHEAEIQFDAGSRLYVYDVMSEDGTKREIEAWRFT